MRKKLTEKEKDEKILKMMKHGFFGVWFISCVTYLFFLPIWVALGDIIGASIATLVVWFSVKWGERFD